MDIFKKHQLKIARDTMKLHCLGVRILGGMNHPYAMLLIKEFTGKTVYRASDCTCGEYSINK